MSFLESDDYKNRKKVDLDDDEMTGLIIVPGQLVFSDIYQPSNGGNDDYAERFGATFRLPKGNEYASKLFAVVDEVGKKTWKKESAEKMEAVWGCVEGGVNPKNSNINIQDGDIHEPSYNRGTWQIKASRRDDEGAPEILLADGTALDFDPTDKDERDEAKKVGPKKGDYCLFMLRVWCQRSRERVNFTLEGVQLAERGTLRVVEKDRKKIASGFSKMKGLPAGFKQLAAPAQEAKPAAKPAKAKVVAAKGVFRKK